MFMKYIGVNKIKNVLLWSKIGCHSKTLLSNSNSLCSLTAAPTRCTAIREDDFDFDFVVVNFYHFVFILDPQAEVAKQKSFLELQVRFHFFAVTVLN